MATRRTTLILKNSSIISRPLPSTLLQGEAIVNTADGIVFFSGVTQSTNGWTPAGTGTTANFFEVGSNLYDLQLRHRITRYDNVTGAGLDGKFLSGTTAGFVLANISDIVGTKVTAFTYNNNVATISQNEGLPDLSILINTMTGLTINGTLSSTTANIGTANINTLNSTAGTINNLVTTNLTASTANITNITGVNSLSATNITGTSVVTTNLTASTANITNLIGVTTLSASSITGTNITGTNFFINGGIQSYSGLTDLSGFFLSGTSNGFVLAPLSAVTPDSFVTAFTYSNNVFTIKQNLGKPDLTALINTVTGLTVNGVLNVTGTTNLSGTTNYFQTISGTNPNEVVNVNYLTAFTSGNDVYVTGATYTGATNNTNNTTFGLTYHGIPLNGPYTISGKDTFITGTTWTPNILTSRRNDGVIINTTIDTFSALTVDNLNITNDVIIQGSLTVLGASVSAFTSQLFVEDSNISLNYNPTASTVATSVCAGWTIQDGNGIAGGDVYFDIEPMNAFTGINGNVPDITEYTSATGFANRAWVTQLNDIVIRSDKATCDGAPDGVRVLAEFDVLDGGSF